MDYQDVSLKNKMDKLSRLNNKWKRYMNSFFNFPEDLDLLSFSGEEAFYPSVDVLEKDAKFILNLELPGVSKEDIKIQIDNHTLIVEGEKKKLKEEHGDYCYKSERIFGKFKRSIELPKYVDTDKINADFKQGILSIHVPKVEASKSKTIKINIT